MSGRNKIRRSEEVAYLPRQAHDARPIAEKRWHPNKHVF